jgi:hypothetical protein
MTDWLDPLRAALDEAPRPIVFFFRDDDAGWRDDRLHRLLDVFARAGAPVDLAAIPCAVSPELARRLAARHHATPQLVRVHQHGFAHSNHEATGRKCEFGPTRDGLRQRDDILCGRWLLRERLDVELDPIFTPPWNRCTPETVRAVREAGLTVLSRESRAESVAAGVRRLDVSVDWLAQRHGVRLTREAVGEQLAAAARLDAPVGVMLHHAVMDDEERAGVARLLALLASSPSARLATMMEVLAA